MAKRQRNKTEKRTQHTNAPRTLRAGSDAATNGEDALQEGMRCRRHRRQVLPQCEGDQLRGGKASPGRAVTSNSGSAPATGRILGILRKRKRQIEFIELLEAIDRATPASVTLIHLLCDNLSIHNGKLARAWLAAHPRFRMHFTPVHCSWMNQVEQWFSILQRKRLRAPNFADLEDKILAFIAEWNELAHRRRPHWTDTLKAAA